MPDRKEYRDLLLVIKTDDQSCGCTVISGDYMPTDTTSFNWLDLSTRDIDIGSLHPELIRGVYQIRDTPSIHVESMLTSLIPFLP